MQVRATANLIAIAVAAALCASLLPAGAGAAVFEHDDRIHISNVHRIDNDLYAFGEDFIMDGVINGELAVFAYDSRINGTVTGSVNIFSYQFQHTGSIDRSLRVFANSAEIGGMVGQSLLLAGGNIVVAPSAVIERDIRLYGSFIRMSGTVGGSGSEIAGDHITIEGTFNGDVKLRGKKITLSPSAVINGNLRAVTATEDKFVIEEGAVITGETIWEPPKPEDGEGEEDEDVSRLTGLVLAVSRGLAAFLFGIIVVAVFRRYADESFQQLRSRFIVSLAAGFMALLILIFAAVVLLVSVSLMIAGFVLISGKGAILGAMLLVFSIIMVPISTFATVSGSIMFYSGKLVIGFLIGAVLLRRTQGRPALHWLNLLVGLAILTAVFAIPYIGFAVYLLVSIVGAGAIVLGVRHCRRPAPGENTAPETPHGPSAPPWEPPPPKPPPAPSRDH